MSGKKYPLGYDPVILSELYTTENRLRTRWFYKNRALLEKSIEEGAEGILDEAARFKLRRELQLAQLRQVFSEPRRVKAGCRAKPKLSFQPDPDIVLDVMRQPTTEQKALLGSYGGGDRYLEERAKMPTDQRYYLPETTNADYGWQSEKLYTEVKKPMHGHSTQAMRLMFRRKGVEPDDPLMRHPFIFAPIECSYI